MILHKHVFFSSQMLRQNENYGNDQRTLKCDYICYSPAET